MIKINKTILHHKYSHLARPLAFAAISLAVVIALVFAASVYAVSSNNVATKDRQAKTTAIAKAKAKAAKEKKAALAKKQAAQKKAAAQKLRDQARRSAALAAQQRQTAVPVVGTASDSSIGALYVDPALRLQGRPERIARHSAGAWFGGWNADVTRDVESLTKKSAAANATSVLVAYNIPFRDCGSYSAGGSQSSAAYRTWIEAFANGIGQRKAVVILEPDALAGIDCLPASGQASRLADMSYAVNVLSRTGAITYIDAGNYTWQSTTTMASRLKAANIAAAKGFSLNVSGYGWSNKSIAYGQQLRTLVGGKGFVVDTSRNGKGPAPNDEWCNPRGRGLGHAPTTNTGVSGLDAYLWVKVPGESDGTCNNGPSAGEWWDDIANELIKNAE